MNFSESEFISDLSFLFENNSLTGTHTAIHSAASIQPEMSPSVPGNRSSSVGVNTYGTSFVNPYQVTSLSPFMAQHPAFHQVHSHEQHMRIQPDLPFRLPSSQTAACRERHTADRGFGPIRRSGSFNVVTTSFAARQDVASTGRNLPLLYGNRQIADPQLRPSYSTGFPNAAITSCRTYQDVAGTSSNQRLLYRNRHTANPQLGSSYSNGFPSSAIASFSTDQEVVSTSTNLTQSYGHRHALVSPELSQNYGYSILPSRMPSSYTLPHAISSLNEQQFAYSNSGGLPVIHGDAVAVESMQHETSMPWDPTANIQITVEDCPPNLSDGYGWLKYGRKNIKSNPYPRSYFRCAVRSCKAKKRIQKSPRGSGSVTFIYTGKHNHPSSS
ncbi:hypothetical protein KP509_28G021300 [Ceratopteris richardii]|uniref:WRKY domain-containing protein n=1 Tax=Ceratopteris richardii TaxID=49495 RepID=A0A8T2RA72_CERRI|nr:hypothetical protein KP509_28G021300 [Ceratopteris richardii]